MKKYFVGVEKRNFRAAKKRTRASLSVMQYMVKQFHYMLMKKTGKRVQCPAVYIKSGKFTENSHAMCYQTRIHYPIGTGQFSDSIQQAILAHETVHCFDNGWGPYHNERFKKLERWILRKLCIKPVYFHDKKFGWDWHYYQYIHHQSNCFHKRAK